ncbi:UNVERIFIED_CONTAM: hypothetical protein GTU68_006071 [Idotea baltica]|nr:hypothetical protein [Idotea baltica]
MSTKKPAVLALADGTVFEGDAIGAEGTSTGEVVFNTSMSGYQEILTDPSYAFQLLTFTTPHIGNVGANSEDVESKRVQAAGLIVRDLSDHYSSHRAEMSLDEYLKKQGTVGISGIDTRELVAKLREGGSQMGVVCTDGTPVESLVKKAKSLTSIEGLDLVKRVTTDVVYDWTEELASRPLVCALDYGVKYNILRLLIDAGFRVKVLPANYSSEQVLAHSPDAIFLSNGPGDPAAVTYAIETVKELLGKKPMFGICLGHQILGHALGAETFKLKFGHRGANHPVRNEVTGVVDITVQNHGFATRMESAPSGCEITHINLNDKTVEGLRVKEVNAFSVQYHPESSPGPCDAKYLFDEFRAMVP